jgi:AcrR family transcriptional regulator
MLKKLTEEKLEEILEAGISEFAEFGPQKAGMNAIARRAGISVGVLYKYYENKDAFYDACLERCTEELDRFVQQLSSQKRKPLDYARELIDAVQQFSDRHRDHIRLYYEATRTADPLRAEVLARRIEAIRSRLYIQIIQNAQDAGDVRSDLDPRVFALFFDNLLVMMELSYCCPYYQQRLKLYTGENSDNAHIKNQLLKFMESAFTLEAADIPHREREIL